MSFKVQFTLTDAMGRPVRRSFLNTKATIAEVLADVVILGPLWDAITVGGLLNISISQKSTATTFSAAAGSNIDTGITLTVLGGNGLSYPMRLPMPTEALKLPGGAVDTDNADLIAFVGQFGSSDPWRVNLDNPQFVQSITKGVVDK